VVLLGVFFVEVFLAGAFLVGVFFADDRVGDAFFAGVLVAVAFFAVPLVVAGFRAEVFFDAVLRAGVARLDPAFFAVVFFTAGDRRSGVLRRWGAVAGFRAGSTAAWGSGSGAGSAGAGPVGADERRVRPPCNHSRSARNVAISSLRSAVAARTARL